MNFSAERKEIRLDMDLVESATNFTEVDRGVSLQKSVFEKVEHTHQVTTSAVAVQTQLACGTRHVGNTNTEMKDLIQTEHGVDDIRCAKRDHTRDG